MKFIILVYYMKIFGIVYKLQSIYDAVNLFINIFYFGDY